MTAAPNIFAGGLIWATPHYTTWEAFCGPFTALCSYSITPPATPAELEFARDNWLPQQSCAMAFVVLKGRRNLANRGLLRRMEREQRDAARKDRDD